MGGGARHFLTVLMEFLISIKILLLKTGSNIEMQSFLFPRPFNETAPLESSACLRIKPPEGINLVQK